MRVLSALLAWTSVSACSLGGPDCIDEDRSFDVAARLEGATAADTGRAFLGLFESRNHSSRRTTAQNIIYNVRAAGVVRASVTALHVHDRNGDRLVLVVPIDTLDNPAITNTYTMRPVTTNAIPWAELYELLGSDGGYFDVHVNGSQTPLLRGDLVRQGEAQRDWRRFVHAYCS